MKKNKLEGAAIWILLTMCAFFGIAGGISYVAKGADLNTPIMVPATVGGYSTVDLLTYVAKLKAADDAKNGITIVAVTLPPTKAQLESQYLKNNIKPVCVKGTLSSLALQLCQASVKQYNKDEAYWVNSQLAK